MTQPPAVSDELATFIREELGLSSKRVIKPEDQMEYDFGVLLAPLFFITNWLLKKRGFLKMPKEVLTVAMLQRAIDLGVWDTEKLRHVVSEPEQPEDSGS